MFIMHIYQQNVKKAGQLSMRTIENAIIRFSGDSGDGMQLVGTQFSNTSAAMGNNISIFPDYPAEIRAPAGSISGVSGVQVNIGSIPVLTPGDYADILVAMNPAALKANLETVKRGGIIILNIDAFDASNLSKAGYKESPIGSPELSSYQIIEAPISTQTLEALKDSPLDTKSKLRCKNFYALGLIYFMYGRELDITINWLKNSFGKNPEVVEANIKVLKAGHNFAETMEASISTFKIRKAKKESGLYRHINGNTAIAWGLIQAAEAAGLNLFLGSYPITPASEILHELSKCKQLGIKTFQAEDEISAVCASIGAAFGGALAATTTSGPGLALKTEAIGLAVMLELPLIIIDVQRGGPSTGLPTKSEQSDLNMAIYGRHGESPLVVLAAASPKDCFQMTFEAARIALTHMTPVILLSDGHLANGAEAWKIPNADDPLYSKIETRLVDPQNLPTETSSTGRPSVLSSDGKFLPYHRDPITLARYWAIPGMPGLEHRIGGLEKKEESGEICYAAENHQRMSFLREEKIERVCIDIPQQEVEGNQSGDLLIISWGGTYGATYSAVKELQLAGYQISLAHIRYLNPLPQNLKSIINNFKKILVPELNNGQLKNILNSKFQCNAIGYNKLQGLPFTITELVTVFKEHLDTDYNKENLN